MRMIMAMTKARRQWKLLTVPGDGLRSLVYYHSHAESILALIRRACYGQVVDNFLTLKTLGIAYTTLLSFPLGAIHH